VSSIVRSWPAQRTGGAAEACTRPARPHAVQAELLGEPVRKHLDDHLGDDDAGAVDGDPGVREARIGAARTTSPSITRELDVAAVGVAGLQPLAAVDAVAEGLQRVAVESRLAPSPRRRYRCDRFQRSLKALRAGTPRQGPPVPQWLSEVNAGSAAVVNPFRPARRPAVRAAQHATLAFELLCQAALACASRAYVSSIRSSPEADRLAAAQQEIRCAAYLIGARLSPGSRKRTERLAWERVLTSPTPPSRNTNQIVALVQQAQDVIEHLLRTCDTIDEWSVASLRAGFALYDLECVSSLEATRDPGP
jgi:hypothetical protein